MNHIPHLLIGLTAIPFLSATATITILAKRAYVALRWCVECARHYRATDREWRGAEDDQALADEAEALGRQRIHDRLIIPFLRDYALLNLLDTAPATARQLAQWEVGRAIAARLDATQAQEGGAA